MDGVQFPFLKDYSQQAMFYGLFEPEVEMAIRSHLPKNGCFVDVGANVGYFTAIAASVAGSGRKFWAFEPHKGHFERLSLFADLNHGRYTISCMPLAVSDVEGAEAKVLAGAQRLILENRIHNMILEISHPGHHEEPPLLPILRKMGMRVLNLATGLPVIPSLSPSIGNVICTPAGC